MKYFMSYIDEEFLEAFFKLKPTDMEANGNDVEIWRHWLEFMKNNTDIDYSGQMDIKYLTYNPIGAFMFKIMNNDLQSKPHITLNTVKLEKITSKDLVTTCTKPTFVFRNNLSNAEITEANTGICCITGETFYEKWQHYFKSKSFGISKNSVKNRLEKWSDLFAGYRYPSNAFVINDNYIFSDKQKCINNLLKILEEILHSTRAVQSDIDLIIVSECKDNDKNDLNINFIYSEIRQHLDNLLFLKVNLGIVKAKYHDRLILSNNFVITSGNSFTYFDNHLTILPKNTHLTISPLTYDYSAINTYKDELSKVINQARIFAGTKENRLLKTFLT